MQISLKLIQLINHAKITVCIKFQSLVTFSSLFTGSSSLSVFPRSVLYIQMNGRLAGRMETPSYRIASLRLKKAIKKFMNAVAKGKDKRFGKFYSYFTNKFKRNEAQFSPLLNFVYPKQIEQQNDKTTKEE